MDDLGRRDVVVSGRVRGGDGRHGDKQEPDDETRHQSNVHLLPLSIRVAKAGRLSATLPLDGGDADTHMHEFAWGLVDQVGGARGVWGLLFDTLLPAPAPRRRRAG